MKSIRMAVCLFSLAALLAWPVAAQAMQPQRILYIRGEFSDVPFTASDPLWLQRLRNVDTVAENFWQYNSYGKVSEFQSSYTDRLLLPASTNFPVGAGLDSAMRNAATAAGWQLSNFDQLVLSYPGVLNQPFGAAASPGRVFLPGTNPYDHGYTHEFGHALGVGHASAFEGGNETYPGALREGRDGLWMMGSEGGVLPIAGRPVRAPINLPMRHKMGFVDESLINRVDEDGVFRIHAFDRDTIDGDVALGRSLSTVFSHDNRDWWISFAPTLADRWANFNGDGWADGIVVQEHRGDITRILDFTPASQGGVGNTEDFVDTRDGALRVGQSYTFPNSELSLSPIATGVSPDGVAYIDVQVLFETPFVPNLLGDFDGNSLVNEADFAILAANLFADTVGDLPASQSYQLGDINGDFVVDFFDFSEFQFAYDVINGPGSFAQIASLPVPEPTTLWLATLLIGMASGLRSRSRL